MTKKSTKLTALLTALVLITSLFVGISIARYITSTSSEDEARVAIWGINEGGTDMDLFNNVYEMPDGTIIAESSGGVNDKIIAPGTSNESQFKILTASSVRPEVMYEVKINLDDSEMPDEIKNHPGIQWKLDNGNYGTWDELKLSLYNLVGNDTGVAVFEPGKVSTELANGVTHTIGWQWVMDSGYDVEDTRLGNLAAEGNPITAKVVVEITAQQTNVDSTGMLYGNGSVYNTNDPQPLIFRADADYSTFKDVEINDTTLNPSNYTPADGSIKITLKKEYLETLPLGEHKITINTTDDKKIESMFTVTDSTTIIHNGIIPEGGTYYVNSTSNTIGNYENSTVYEAGSIFPKPQIGDVYVYGDYEYKYGYNADEFEWINTHINGWGLGLRNRTKTQYGRILSTINNIDLISIYSSFNNTMIEVAPIIPSTIGNIGWAFAYCPNLSGTIEINSKNLTNYTNALKDTNITWIEGSISEDLKQSIANDSGITLIHPDIHNGKIPVGGTYYVGGTLGTGDTWIGDYSSATNTLTEGNDFPIPQTGDVYVYGDYEYRYNVENAGGPLIFDENLNGWNVFAIDKTKTHYGKILTTIANKNVVAMTNTFGDYSTGNIVVSPKIPTTVRTMVGTFAGCSNLTTPPIIHKNVTMIDSIFMGCTKLTTIEINSTPIYYNLAITNTGINTITGSCPDNIKQAILDTVDD